jgi:3-hydroxyacyl-[acyl-carrier-protein] dehydratase
MNELNTAIEALFSEIPNSGKPLSIEIIFQLKMNFPAFRGHFPTQPILPAMVQILIAHKLIQKALGQSYPFKELSRAKFMHPVQPNMDIRLHCRQNDHNLNFFRISLYNADVLYSDFTIELMLDACR